MAAPTGTSPLTAPCCRITRPSATSISRSTTAASAISASSPSTLPCWRRRCRPLVRPPVRGLQHLAGTACAELRHHHRRRPSSVPGHQVLADLQRRLLGSPGLLGRHRCGRYGCAALQRGLPRPQHQRQQRGWLGLQPGHHRQEPATAVDADSPDAVTGQQCMPAAPLRLLGTVSLAAQGLHLR